MSAGDGLVLAANLTWATTGITAVVMADAWEWGAVWLLVGGFVVTLALFVAAFRTLKEKP